MSFWGIVFYIGSIILLGSTTKKDVTQLCGLIAGATPKEYNPGTLESRAKKPGWLLVICRSH